MDQMQTDCYRRINERLGLWIKDSVQLYDIAGLQAYAFEDVISALLSQFISGLIAMDYSEQRAKVMAIEAIRMAYEDKRAGKLGRRDD